MRFPSEAYTIDELDQAAIALLAGECIGWEPGDGTHYDLMVVKARNGKGRGEFLISPNLMFIVPWSKHNLRMWMHYLPRGSWAGLKPLLTASGMTPYVGSYGRRYNPDDWKEESAEREELVGEEKLSEAEIRADARLGAKVRHALGADGIKADDS